MLELGRPYLSSLTLPEIALPHLRDVTDELRESSSLAVLDGTDIVYVAHAPAKRILSISITIGTRDPAFATSLGRVLLAGQDDDWLDNYLATVELPPITPATITDPGKLRAELARSAAKAAHSSTRNSKTASAPSPHPSTTNTATSSPPPTSPSTPAAGTTTRCGPSFSRGSIAAVAAIERDIGAAGSGSGLHAAGAPV